MKRLARITKINYVKVFLFAGLLLMMRLDGFI